MKIKRAIKSYLRDCQNLSRNTLKLYRQILGRLRSYLRKKHIKRIRQIRPDHLRRFLIKIARGRLRDRGSGPVSANTLHQHWRGLRTFFRWLEREAVITASPMAHIRPPCQPHPSTRYLSPERISDLLAACLETQNPIRDLAIVCLFIDTGIRRSELADLTLEDLDLAERVITIRLGKMGRGRRVPISERCREVIAQWIAIRPETPRLFGLGPQNIYQIFYRLRRRFPEVGRIYPHLLRHTFGTLYGGGIRDTSLILGHSDINLTASIYSHREALDLRRSHNDRSPLRLVKITTCQPGTNML